MITLPLRSSPAARSCATVRDASGAVLFTAEPKVCAQIAADVNAVDKLSDALRLIKNQVTAPDWTAEQAIAFIKKHAGEVIREVDSARAVAVHESCNQRAKSDPAMTTPSLAAMTRHI